jgi:hypothetical protein
MSWWSTNVLLQLLQLVQCRFLMSVKLWSYKIRSKNTIMKSNIMNLFDFSAHCTMYTVWQFLCTVVWASGQRKVLYKSCNVTILYCGRHWSCFGRIIQQNASVFMSCDKWRERDFLFSVQATSSHLIIYQSILSLSDGSRLLSINIHECFLMKHLMKQSNHVSNYWLPLSVLITSRRW